MAPNHVLRSAFRLQQKIIYTVAVTEQPLLLSVYLNIVVNKAIVGKQIAIKVLIHLNIIIINGNL